MAEFYVKLLIRRQGLEEKCAEAIFLIHPGKWGISFNKHNNANRNLWHKLVQKLAKNTLEEGQADNDHCFIRFTLK
jgi:predicted acetyltransferase